MRSHIDISARLPAVITHSLFHYRLKTFLFCKSFPLQLFFFFILGRISQDNLELLSTPAGTVERVTTFKVLGIHLNDTLTWSTHVNAITSKATKRLYFLKTINKGGGPLSRITSFLHRSYPSCPRVRGPRLALCHHPSTNTAT